MTEQPEPDLRSPAPPDLTVNTDKIGRLLAETIEAESPELFDELMNGGLAWMLDDFDAEGWAHVTVIRRSTGEDVGGAECHWSAVAAPLV